jgi:hypothetical protein
MKLHPSNPEHSKCPECGNELEGQRSLTAKRPPRPGDYTVCAACLVPLQFGDRELVAVDLAQAPSKIRDALGGVIAAAKAQRGLA